jgi:flagellar biosynthesis/type III secretory pathway protein FliH
MGARIWKPLLAAAMFFMTAAPLADAGQLGRARGRDDDRGRQNTNRNAYDDGYQDGLQRGEADARSGRPFGGSVFSDRNDYGVGFVDGYRTGYDRQYVFRANRGRSDARVLRQQRGTARGYREPAFATGFDSGYENGLKDGRDGDRYDPVRHRDYRDGERGYRDGYGSRDGYRTNFRTGFRQGYEEGYRAGTRNRR